MVRALLIVAVGALDYFFFTPATLFTFIRMMGL